MMLCTLNPHQQLSLSQWDHLYPYQVLFLVCTVHGVSSEILFYARAQTVSHENLHHLNFTVD